MARWSFAAASAVATCCLAPYASASTVTYDIELEFKRDYVTELHEGWETGRVCYNTMSCYPDDFRLPTGYFVDLSFGERVFARFSFDTNGSQVIADSAEIAGWGVIGDLLYATDVGLSWLQASWYSPAPTGIVEVDLLNRSIAVSSEGPGDYSYSKYCDPLYSHPELPSGYCGYFGYHAEFDIVGYWINGRSVSRAALPAAVPVAPALPLMTSALLLLFVSRRFARSHL